MTYNKMETVDTYGSGCIQQDKSVAKREKIADVLWNMLKGSKYTYGELLERLGWEDIRLRLIFAGDADITIYELTHITGAMDCDFDIIWYS